MTVLQVPDGSESYLWIKDKKYFGDTNMIFPDEEGNYSVSAVNASNCRSRDTIQIINARTYQEEAICLVTVDPSTGNNMIIWNRTQGRSTNRYNIYRETDVTGNYELVGQTNFNDPGQLIDKNSDPNQQSYRYKLALVDTCGNESNMSNHHSTIHLTRNLGVGQVVNLIWSQYEGFPVTTYNIWKGSGPSDLMKIGSISGNNFTFTDQSPNVGQTFYAVEVVSPNSCNTQIKKSTYSSSFSNIVSINITGMDANKKSHDLIAYPNPFSTTSIIKFPANETDKSDLYLYDVTGKLVFRANDLEGPTFELSRKGLKSGLYLMRISGASTHLGKIMIN